MAPDNIEEAAEYARGIDKRIRETMQIEAMFQGIEDVDEDYIGTFVTMGVRG